ncbi:MAG: endonuclease domain-containing protein [Gorillibacterium sp.]|nr:endonuclease domain-containing protein [Gorillibacterium sp.]
MDFEQAHQVFLEHHAAYRTGERKGRLLRGHQHAEKLLLQNVWWPLIGSFDHLHPEYEIVDWNRKSQFLDFAFLPTFGRFGLECDGFQSHVLDMDREKFSHSLNRETFLTGMGWKMIHVSYDDVLKRPEVCRMLVKLVISPYLIRSPSSLSISPTQKEVLRFAWSLGKPFRSKDVADQYRVNFRTARKWLQAMVENGLLHPLNNGKHIHYYELNQGALEHLF